MTNSQHLSSEGGLELKEFIEVRNQNGGLMAGNGDSAWAGGNDGYGGAGVSREE